MSKQSIAKEQQNYRPEERRNCGNCGNFKSDKETHLNHFNKEYIIEKNKRCGIGRFAVNVTAVCNEWKPGDL